LGRDQMIYRQDRLSRHPVPTKRAEEGRHSSSEFLFSWPVPFRAGRSLIVRAQGSDVPTVFRATDLRSQRRHLGAS
jgi:hypothetical protein